MELALLHAYLDHLRYEDFYVKRDLEKVLNYEKDFETGLAYSIGLILVKGKPYIKAISVETGIKVINLSEFLSEETRCFEPDQLFQKG
jgi:hypothetical protein